ncbi:hypothetical protein HD554DRAFT_2224609, partial [Boletus coccyginus]
MPQPKSMHEHHKSGSAGTFDWTSGYNQNTAATGAPVFASAAPSTGSGGSPFGLPKPSTTFGATPANANPPSAMTGVSAPARPTSSNKGPPSPSTITVTPPQKGPSSENLRAPDYQQNPLMAGASGPKSGAPPTQTSSFGVLFSAQHVATGSTFGGCTTGASGAPTSQLSTGPFGAIREQSHPTGTATGTGIFTGNPAFGKPQQQEPAGGTGTGVSGGTSPLGQPMPAKGVGGRFGKPDPSKLEGMEELLRKSLLGEELVNTQFLLFTARSSSSGRVVKPRVLCANNTPLAKNSKYFLDLLSSDTSPSDPSLIDLMDDDDVPNNARIDDYGYGSDSDIDEYDDPIPVANPEAPKDRAVASPISPSQVSESQPEDDNELSEDGSGSPGSDVFVVSPGQPRTDKPLSVNKDRARSVASSGTAVQETVGSEGLEKQTAIRLRSLGSRRVLVKDTAFQTWYTLLNYFYTGKFGFRPLSSTTRDGHHESSTSSVDTPKCSAKSMYRLASKVGLGHLRDEAFSYIRSNLTEHNILQEISCSIISKHPELLELELDVLYSRIASPPVVANFATLAQRIANGELAHGADIIMGIHARLLQE